MPDRRYLLLLKVEILGHREMWKTHYLQSSWRFQRGREAQFAVISPGPAGRATSIARRGVQRGGATAPGVESRESTASFFKE